VWCAVAAAGGCTGRRDAAPWCAARGRAYLWSYCTTQFNPLKAVVFDFADSRGGQHVRDFLGLPGTEQDPGWQGKLVTDDFSGYKACFELGVTEVGCMAHARRKFHELWVNHQSLTASASRAQNKPAFPAVVTTILASSAICPFTSFEGGVLARPVHMTRPLAVSVIVPLAA
jgi:Transposase IS66 family